MDILWRVFHILMEPVLYTFASVNQWNNEAWAHIAMWARLHYSVNLRMQTYTEAIPLNYGKLATKYPWIYGYILQCTVLCDGDIDFLIHFVLMLVFWF